MKKIISMILVLSVCIFSLVSCGGNSGDELEGYYTAGDYGYFFTDGDGIIIVTDGSAQSSIYEEENGKYYIGPVADVILVKSQMTEATFSAPTMGSEEYFIYQTTGNQVSITGLTEAGKKQKVLFAPKGVTNISEGAFSESTALEAFVIGDTDTPLNLSNGAFKGTDDIDVYIVAELEPGIDLTCGASLLKDTDDITFKVEKSAYASYKEHYTWGNFADEIEKF